MNNKKSQQEMLDLLNNVNSAPEQYIDDLMTEIFKHPDETINAFKQLHLRTIVNLDINIHEPRDIFNILNTVLRHPMSIEIPDNFLQYIILLINLFKEGIIVPPTLKDRFNELQIYNELQ